MGKMKERDSELQDLREEFFDGPMSDSMSFDQFLLNKGKGDLLKLSGRKPIKKNMGGAMCRGMGKARGGNYTVRETR